MKENSMVQSDNAFVRKEQAKQRGMMGNRPKMKPEMERFNAYMSNDGMNAKDFARDLTRDIDDCFPVK